MSLLVKTLAAGLALSSVHAAGSHNAITERNGVLAGSYVNNITVSASNVVQCGEATVSWTGTTGNVQLEIGWGGMYVGTKVITTIDNLSGSSTTWKVTAAPSQGSLIFQITDADEKIGYIQGVPVQASSDSSCLSGSGAAESSSSSSTHDPNDDNTTPRPPAPVPQTTNASNPPNPNVTGGSGSSSSGSSESGSSGSESNGSGSSGAASNSASPSSPSSAAGSDAGSGSNNAGAASPSSSSGSAAAPSSSSQSVVIVTATSSGPVVVTQTTHVAPSASNSAVGANAGSAAFPRAVASLALTFGAALAVVGAFAL